MAVFPDAADDAIQFIVRGFQAVFDCLPGLVVSGLLAGAFGNRGGYG